MVCGNIFKALSIQNRKARELKFRENVHPTLCVMCHVSPVTCHISKKLIFDKKKKKKRKKWWSNLVEGLLSKGPTPSSFLIKYPFSPTRPHWAPLGRVGHRVAMSDVCLCAPSGAFFCKPLIGFDIT